MYNVEVKEKRQYDRLISFLATRGYIWKSLHTLAEYNAWEDVKQRNDRIKAIIVYPASKSIAYVRVSDISSKDLSYITPTELKVKLNKSLQGAEEVTGSVYTPRTFRLIRDTVELKAGALVQEVAPDREYIVIGREFIKFPEDCKLYFRSTSLIRFSRKTVETQKRYFEQVYPTNEYFNAEELAKFQSWAKRSLRK